ncbi:SurA N-terminal domain-containing protein, partial [Gammaproteobacteria bacterium]|nr:SurA N-terminal domain-containing protein [Gammaproteobacteria bacterium]
WGVNEYFSGGTSLNIAIVNGQEITQQEYRYALEERRSMARRVLGAQFDPDMVNSREFRNAVVDDLILRQLLDQDADQAGYRVSDEDLAEFIATTPRFQTNGQFDPAMYQQQLLAQGFSKVGYEAYLRREFVLQQLRDGLGNSSFVTRRDQEDFLKLAQEKRVFDYASIEPDSYIANIEVSEEDINESYQENQETYQSPEMIKVEYVQLSVDDLAQSVEVTDEDVERYFADNKGLYKTPEQRVASHILITVSEDADEATVQEALGKAKDLADRANAGEDFAELAKAHSEDPGSAATGGDLGMIETGLMVKPFEDKLFSLQEGEISEPVKTRYGFHVIKLTELIPETGKELSEVRDEIEAEEKKNKAEEIFVDRAESFRNIVFEQPESLDAVVEELGLELQVTEWFTRDSGTGIAQSGIVRDSAFSDDVYLDNLNSEAIELDIDTLIALRKQEMRAAAVKPLEEVRAEIEDTLKQQRARERVVGNGEELLGELRENDAWEALMSDNGLESKQSTQTRLMPNPDTSMVVSKEVFRAEPPEQSPVYGAVNMPDGSFVLYRLTDVQSGVPDAAEESTSKQIEDSLTKRRGSEYFLSYQNGLRDSAKVEIFEQNL